MTARLDALRRPGLFVLGSAALSLAVHVWIIRSELLSIRHEHGVEYVFVSASFGTFALALLGSCLLLAALHVLVRRVEAGSGAASRPALFARGDVAWLRPLLLLAASGSAVAGLLPGLGGFAPVWLYLVVDLRGWWTLLVAAWVAWRIVRRLGGAGAPVRFSAPVRRWAPGAVLVSVAAVWVVAGTPNLRFDTLLHGDEPRYLRYCETLYQGVGFDISGLRPIAELPADFQPRVGRNVEWLAAILPRELQGLAHDAAAFAAEPGRRFNRAQWLGAYFVAGKSGGTYQVHQPGLSLLLFPACYLDRRFGEAGPASSHPHWPHRRVAVHALLLAFYLAWAVCLFRLVRRVVGDAPVAWVATLALALTLPAAALPFQVYPELPASLLIFLVAGHALAPGSGRAAGSFVHGLLAGYLPWLHVRFGPAAALLAVAVVLARRREPRRIAAFVAGLAVPLGCLALYDYRITGSVLPTALYGAQGSPPNWLPAAVASNSVAYLLDGTWGLLSNAPVYLLALPGCWWLFRRRPEVACLCGLLLLALLLPAAGHALAPPGGPPGRLIAAAAPLAAVPLAELLARRGHRRWLQVAFGLLLVLSLDNALAYNYHRLRHVGEMLDHSLSGWKLQLLFPGERGAGWWLLPVLVAAPGAFRLLARGWAALVPRSGLRLPRVGSGGAGPLAAAGSVLLAATLVGVTATLAGIPDVAVGERFRRPETVSIPRAAELLGRMGHCAICISSVHGRIGTATLSAALEEAAPGTFARASGRFEAESVPPGATTAGTIVREAHASGGAASRPARRNGLVVVGPSRDLDPGRYRATVALRLAAPSSARPAAWFDVTAAGASVVVAAASIASAQLRDDGAYSAVSLEFHAHRTLRDVAFRVRPHPEASLLVDFVDLLPLPTPGEAGAR